VVSRKHPAKTKVMKVFVSGATGFIGSRLVKELAGKGYIVHALYRSLSKTKELKHPNIVLFKGDILDSDSLDKAMNGCERAFHAAAFANIWDKDISRIYRLNIEGSMNVIRSAIRNKVKRIVCTSTAGVMGPSNDVPLDENSAAPAKYFIDYEASKAILEKVLFTLHEAGIEIVIVNPTRVYGPGLLSESNSVTRMIEKYIQGKWHFIPGDGKSVGNYVHVNDVVQGHILAMEKGRRGERYLLGGENADYLEFFATLSELIGKKYTLYKIPLGAMLALSRLIMLRTRLFGVSPAITPALVRKFNHNFKISSSKAEEELGYRPVSLRDGMKDTVEWLRSEAARE
jgi:nucleoside-diphosphate-sugar epimerase